MRRFTPTNSNAIPATMTIPKRMSDGCDHTSTHTRMALGSRAIVTAGPKTIEDRRSPARHCRTPAARSSRANASVGPSKIGVLSHSRSSAASAASAPTHATGAAARRVARANCASAAMARTIQASSGADISQLVHRVQPLATPSGTERVATPNISPAPSTPATTDVAGESGSNPSSRVTHRANSGQPMNSAPAIRRLRSSNANNAAAIVTIAPTGGDIWSMASVSTTVTARLSAALTTVAAQGLTVNSASANARKATAASVISR